MVFRIYLCQRLQKQLCRDAVPRNTARNKPGVETYFRVPVLTASAGCTAEIDDV
jgi:hypothetical protein